MSAAESSTGDLRFLSGADLRASLLATTREWNWSDDVPKDHTEIAKAIGRELHTRGGIEAMREAYRHAVRANRFAKLLNLLWDGIGEWRA